MGKTHLRGTSYKMAEILEMILWFVMPDPSYRWMGRRLYKSKFIENRKSAPLKQKIAIHTSLFVLTVGGFVGLFAVIGILGRILGY